MGIDKRERLRFFFFTLDPSEFGHIPEYPHYDLPAADLLDRGADGNGYPFAFLVDYLRV